MRTVARTTSGIDRGKTSFYWWKFREWRMRLGLIPVSNGVVVIRTMIGMAMFDCALELLGERYWRIEMETIDEIVAASKL